MTGMPIKRRTFRTAKQKLPTFREGKEEEEEEEEQQLDMKFLVSNFKR